VRLEDIEVTALVGDLYVVERAIGILVMIHLEEGVKIR
jgi:hypothetical protein